MEFTAFVYQVYNQILSSFLEFTTFANITESARGFPRLISDGYHFGLPKMNHINKETIVWQCTGSDANRKRCTASVVTKTIDGYAMMCDRKREHICTKPTPNTKTNE